MTTPRLRTGPLSAFAIAFAVCSVAGCSDDAISPPETSAASEATPAEEATAQVQSAVRTDLPPTSAACPATRWIAYHPTGRCLDPNYTPHGRWRATHVFDTAAGIPASANIPPGLGYFCSYDWESPTGDAPDLVGLPKLDARSSLGPDCMAVSALAPGSLADAPEIWGPLRTKTLAQSGVTKLAPTAISGAPARNVRVAVVDSAPSTPFDGQAGLEGRYAHGHNVGRLVRELTCPGDGLTSLSACIGRVSNHLALPLVDPTHEDRVNGGFFGRQSDLAAAIREAASAPPSTSLPTSHTVINLSVGWDSMPGYGGAYTTPADLQPPARAVHAALVHAACINVLTFAAAGNRTYGAASIATKGAMYPAAWETKRAPTVAECIAMEGPGYTPPVGIAAANAPLVYAVGGLDARDKPLENSRELGRPRLNAYGFTVVSSNLGGGHTDPMTGTSMATATASAAASVVWAYKPELTPRDVVTTLLASAAPLALEQADFCFGAAPCGNASRISVGAAYARAQCNGDAACAANLFAKPVPYSGKNPTWSTSWATAVPGGVDRLAEAKPCPDVSVGSCIDPTTKVQTKEATPWVQPQPGAHGCDICGLGGTELFVTLDPSIYMNTQLGYLTLYGANPNATVQYVIPVPAGAQTFSVGNVVPPAGGTTAAALSFKVAAPSGTFVTHEQIPAW